MVVILSHLLTAYASGSSSCSSTAGNSGSLPAPRSATISAGTSLLASRGGTKCPSTRYWPSSSSGLHPPSICRAWGISLISSSEARTPVWSDGCPWMLSALLVYSVWIYSWALLVILYESWFGCAFICWSPSRAWPWLRGHWRADTFSRTFLL